MGNPEMQTDADGDGQQDYPILYVHGALDGSYSSIARALTGDSMQRQFAQRGHDVWIYGARGTTDSNVHDRDGDEDFTLRERWDFDWADMGMLDMPPVIEKILEVTGKEKITILGHSQGSSLMWYALAKNQDYFATRVNRFVAIAACLFPEAYAWGNTYEKLGNIYFALIKNEIYHVAGGPDLDENSTGFGGLNCYADGGDRESCAEADGYEGFIPDWDLLERNRQSLSAFLYFG